MRAIIYIWEAMPTRWSNFCAMPFPAKARIFTITVSGPEVAMNLMNSKRSQWMKDLKLMTTLNKPI